MTEQLCGRRILVVEDEMMVFMMIEDMLAEIGCEAVSAAATVGQALALIGSTFFDAAMLDMNLNGDMTDDVADALAAHGVPFVFSTGYGGRDARSAHGDRPLLKKPFQHDDLVKVFHRLLPG